MFHIDSLSNTTHLVDIPRVRPQIGVVHNAFLVALKWVTSQRHQCQVSTCAHIVSSVDFTFLLNNNLLLTLHVGH